MSTDLTDQISRIFEHAKHEALALLLEAKTMVTPASAVPVALSPNAVDEATQEQINQYCLLAHKPYLSRKEAAIYLGISERSIGEWSARPPDQNPFPEARAGGEPRTKRTAIDEWAERERQRQRLKLAG